MVVASDLNKYFADRRIWRKKRNGSADLHTPIHPPPEMRGYPTGLNVYRTDLTAFRSNSTLFPAENDLVASGFEENKKMLKIATKRIWQNAIC